MKQPIENILAKYFSGETNTKELEFVEKWKSENLEEFEKYKKTWKVDIFESKLFNQKDPLFFINHESKSRFLLRRWQRVAAIFIGFMVLGALLYFYNQSLQVEINNITSINETHLLPDGSEVILSGNSHITYSKTWLGQFNRNLDLSGRAYFKVTKDISNPFSVLTKNIQVTVLGTEFVVNEIGEKTQVVLSEGKIQLCSKIFDKPIILDKPGDQLIINSQKVVKHNKVQASLYAAWKEEKLYFNNCTVEEILNLLDDSYNVQLDLSDEKMLNRKLLGSAPSDDPQLIINALSQILQKNLEKNN